MPGCGAVRGVSNLGARARRNLASAPTSSPPCAPGALSPQFQSRLWAAVFMFASSLLLWYIGGRTCSS